MADGGYSAGNLEFQIQALGKDTTATFSKINSHLKTSAFSITRLLNRVYFLRNYTKQMFSTIGNMLKLAVDYTETLNLWQVAMRENREEANEFVKTMNKAYGISTQTLMNYQAIFKNMLSSLGGLGENTSYALSEYLTQMAIDYASLYNTSIERAMTTFQSVLSGQVRPIRSIAGYDITETTIYQLYQQLGGTKTMRQLTQTEKRLLRIYAVFQQMESSGAIGDLSATLNNTANQMRILTESSKELQTWFGLIVEDIFKPAIPYLNAFVITLTNIVKAIAQMRGVELFERGVVESVEEVNEALDATQGKLLSFDKFEALNSASGQDNLLGIDENLLAGLSQYRSILSQVTGEAQKLAEQWTSWWVDEDTGELTQQAQDLARVLEGIGVTLGVLVSFGLIKKIATLISRVSELTTGAKLLDFAIKAGIVYSIYEMINAFREGNNVMGVVYAFITGSLLVAYGMMYISKRRNAQATLSEAQATAVHASSMQALTQQITMQLDAILLRLGASQKELDMIYALTNAENQRTNATNRGTIAVKQQAGAWQIAQKGITAFSMSLMTGLSILSLVPEEGRKTVGIIMTITGAVMALVGAIIALQGAKTMGFAIPILMAGVGTAIAGVAGWTGTLNSSITAYKSGGHVEDGVFTMNKKEMAGSFDDGTAIVANNMQIQQGIADASYRGLSRAMREYGYGGGVGDVYLDGRKVGQTTARYSHQENVRTGLVKATR